MKKTTKKKFSAFSDRIIPWLIMPPTLLLLFLPNFIPHRLLVSACLIAILICDAVGILMFVFPKKNIFFVLIPIFCICFAAHLILLFTCNYTFVDPSPLFIASFILGAIPGTFITFRFFRKDTKLLGLIGWLLLFILIFSAFFYLFSSHLNYALDFYPPVECEAIIEDKDINRHRKGPDDYELIVTIDGKRITMDVSSEEYRRYDIGDTYTFYRYQGAFNIPFYFEE